MTTETSKETPPAVSHIGVPLVLASALASTLGIVIAQFLDDLGDGILAEILGGDAVLYNNRVEFTGPGEVAGGGVGLLLVALSAAAAFLAFTPHRRLVSTGRKRLVFALWIALIPAVASAFAAIPFFLPDSEGLVLPGLPMVAVMFLLTLAAAPGTTTVIGPEDERTTPWPWGLAVFLLVLLVFNLTILQGGISIDPRAWGGT